MADKTWKAFERRVSTDWATVRTALSGGNGKVTRSDTHHPGLFIECKHNQESAVWTLYLKTREIASDENKTAILCLGKKHQKGYLLVAHCDTLPQLIVEFLRSNGHGDLANILADRVGEFEKPLKELPSGPRATKPPLKKRTKVKVGPSGTVTYTRSIS